MLVLATNRPNMAYVKESTTVKGCHIFIFTYQLTYQFFDTNTARKGFYFKLPLLPDPIPMYLKCDYHNVFFMHILQRAEETAQCR